jgi:hypothetical protein
MGMTDEVWARHANPWSGWTRVATTPVLFLALWSHVWLGWWALVPIAAVAGWIRLNPRIFPPPASTDNWMSKGVLGERLWLNRDAVAIPRHHARAAQLTSAASALFLLPAAWGFVAQDFWAAFLGVHASAAMKLWFVDRMVWLYEDVRARAEA